MKKIDFIFKILFVISDFLLAVAAFFLAYYVRQFTDLIPGVELPITLSEFPAPQDYLWTAAIFSAVLILIFSWRGHYSFAFKRSLTNQNYAIITDCVIWLMSIIAIYFFLRTFPYSRLALLQTFLSTTILIIIGRSSLRALQNYLYHNQIGQIRVLIYGHNSLSNNFCQKFFSNPKYRCLGYISQHENKDFPQKYLGQPEELFAITEKKEIDQILYFSHADNPMDEMAMHQFSRENHLLFSLVPQKSRNLTGLEIDLLENMPVFHIKLTTLDGWGRIFKRIFDLAASSILILLLSPVMLLIAILIKLDDRRGTILFKHLDDGQRVKRVGEKGKLFSFYKFRTMKPNSHNLRYTELADRDIRNNSPLVKIKNDPRVTPIGRILRRFSLDELPQLFNVWKGEMSLVGPRPHLPEEVAKYQKHHRFVLSVKPGITGLAQISGRSDLDFEKENQLDSYYIEHWNPLLDIKILLKTVFVVFQKHQE